MPENSTVTPQRVRRQGQRLTKEERRIAQEKFLRSFSMTVNVRAACMVAGIERATVYKWQEHDEQFGFKFRQATEDANDIIRAELFRRAIQGVEKPVVSMGRVVEDKNGNPLMVREYSDSLLSLLAKARMPEFRDKQQIEHSGNVGQVGFYEAVHLPQKQPLQEGGDANNVSSNDS